VWSVYYEATTRKKLLPEGVSSFARSRVKFENLADFFSKNKYLTINNKNLQTFCMEREYLEMAELLCLWELLGVLEKLPTFVIDRTVATSPAFSCKILVDSCVDYFLTKDSRDDLRPLLSQSIKENIELYGAVNMIGGGFQIL
jgi:hypothetical protein